MSRHAFTLIELLVAMVIIAAIVCILLPALSMGQEAAKVAVCLANFREIVWTAGAYSNDNDPGGMGSCPTQPWFMDTSGYTGIEVVTGYVYGGHQHVLNNCVSGGSPDTYVIPTEDRPYNKYVAPGASGRNPVKQFVCPSDNFFLKPPPIREGTFIEDDRLASWQVCGSSYAISWHWREGAPFAEDLATVSLLGSIMLAKKVGGAASEFVLFIESPMNTRLFESRPPGLPAVYAHDYRGIGWHRKFSTYTMGFLDGHAECRYLDTRYTSGPGYNLWPEPNTPWPQL